MRDGFTLCILLQIQAIEFEIDANFVIVFLTDYEASYAPIVDDYKNLMNRIPLGSLTTIIGKQTLALMPLRRWQFTCNKTLLFWTLRLWSCFPICYMAV